MAKEITFQLDPKGGEDILQRMVAPVIERSAKAIQSRAQGMAGSTSTDPPDISVSMTVGVIKRGRRAIATVQSDSGDKHQSYIGRQALSKSKDAGRVI